MKKFLPLMFAVLAVVLLVIACNKEADSPDTGGGGVGQYGSGRFYGTLEVDGAVDLNSTLDVDGAATLASLTNEGALAVTGDATLSGIINVGINDEHIGLPTIASQAITYTQDGAVFTIGDGEIWFVHKVFVNVTTNFDCTGDDCTLIIGDGNDDNGFISAADAALQAAATEATGYAAGWYGIENGSGGAYTLDDGGPFVYAPSGAAETIDATVGGTSPAGGAATIYIIYTRIQ